MTNDWAGASIDLLVTFITNACVNTGAADSGNEIVSVRTIQDFMGDPGVVVEPLPAGHRLCIASKGPILTPPACC